MSDKTDRNGAQHSRTDGRYVCTKGARLCVCGRMEEVHDAESPRAFGDLALDGRDLPDCARFRPVRRPDPEKLAAALAAAG